MISSGAMYSGVPSTIPAPVAAGLDRLTSASAEASALITPKSPRNACPYASKRMFPGLTSRWMYPRMWM